MSFDKHYPNRKDHRRPYRGAASFDGSCRPHGGCPYCETRRRIRSLRLAQRERDELRHDAAEVSLEEMLTGRYRWDIDLE